MPEVFQPDDHLSRLLAPQSTEIPWYKSLYETIHDIIKPEKLPPLEVTSKPVPVKDIWGLYATDPKKGIWSVVIHIVVVAFALIVFTNPTVQKLGQEERRHFLSEAVRTGAEAEAQSDAGRRWWRCARTASGIERAASEAFDEAVRASDDCGSHAETGDGSEHSGPSRYSSSSVESEQLGRPARQDDERVEREWFRRGYG